MIMGFGLVVVVIGIIFSIVDVFIPVTPGSAIMVWSLRMMGVVFAFIGIFMIGARSWQTGAGLWLDLPSRDRVICIHSGISGKRLDPNAKFITAKDIGLGILKSKKKAFKDTGGGFRICGHDVRRTHEKIGADIPEWLGQYLHQVKQKWKVNTHDELIGVYEVLKGLRNPRECGRSVVEQLRGNRVFEPVLRDSNAVNLINGMSFEDVRRMREYLLDGESIHMEDVERFIDMASPNELDTWIQQEMNVNQLENRQYKDAGVTINWNLWLPSLGFFMIIGILGTVILLSYLN